MPCYNFYYFQILTVSICFFELLRNFYKIFWEIFEDYLDKFLRNFFKSLFEILPGGANFPWPPFVAPFPLSVARVMFGVLAGSLRRLRHLSVPRLYWATRPLSG